MSDDSKPLYEKIITENLEKGTQLRLVLSEFRGVEYLHLRKYYQSYEGDFVPTKEGASMPATLASSFALLDGLIEICSLSESIDSITTHLNNRLEELKNGSSAKIPG